MNTDKLEKLPIATLKEMAKGRAVIGDKRLKQTWIQTIQQEDISIETNPTSIIDTGEKYTPAVVGILFVLIAYIIIHAFYHLTIVIVKLITIVLFSIYQLAIDIQSTKHESVESIDYFPFAF
jgi:hypothetical protein